MTLPSKDYGIGIPYTRSPRRWTGTESHQWLRPKTQAAKVYTEAPFDIPFYFLKCLEIIVSIVALLPFPFDAH